MIMQFYFRLAQIQDDDEDFYSRRQGSSRNRHRHDHVMNLSLPYLFNLYFNRIVHPMLPNYSHQIMVKPKMKL